MPNPYDLMSMLFGQGQTNVQYPGPPQTMQNNSDTERQRLLDIMFNTQAAPVPEEKRNYLAEGLAVLGDAMARSYGQGQGGNALESIREMRERRRQEAQQLEETKAEQKKRRALLEFQSLDEKVKAEKAFEKDKAEKAERDRREAEKMAFDVGAQISPGMTTEEIKAAAFAGKRRKEDLYEQFKTQEDDIKRIRQEHQIELDRLRLDNSRRAAAVGPDPEKIDRRDKIELSNMKQSLANLVDGGVDEQGKPIPSLMELLKSGATTPEKVRTTARRNVQINQDLLHPALLNSYIDFYAQTVEPILEQFEDEQRTETQKQMEAAGLAIPRRVKRIPESDLRKEKKEEPLPNLNPAFMYKR